MLLEGSSICTSYTDGKVELLRIEHYTIIERTKNKAVIK